MGMTIDYPNCRASRACPVCLGGKDAVCVVCWGCYRAHDFRNGATREAMALVDAFEAKAARDATDYANARAIMVRPVSTAAVAAKATPALRGGIDRSAIARAMAKAIAYHDCGKPSERDAWAAELVRLLGSAGILKGDLS